MELAQVGSCPRRCSTRSRGPSSASASRSSSSPRLPRRRPRPARGLPGLAKTLAARSFAQVLSMRFARIQFTPDLMPSDVTGSSIWNQRDGDFEFRPGPIFTNLLLADEINRAPPKTQAALLEAMQERQVTIEGVTHAARAALPRHRDAEPDRVRGHVPAPRGAARPLPPAHGVRLSEPRRTRSTCSPVASSASPTRSSSGRSSTARRSSRCRRRRARARRDERAGVLRRPRRGDARVAEHRGRREPARQPRAPEARALPGRARRPRLRPAGRRQGDRGARARTPARPPARALGAARLGRGRRPRGARDASRRRGPRTSRRAAPRDADRRARGSSATRRSPPSGWSGRSPSAGPELAVVAAPFALLLAIGTRVAREPGVVRRRRRWRTSERSRAPRSTPVVAVRTDRTVDRLELLLEPPAGVEVADGSRRARAPSPQRARARARPRPALHALGRVRRRPRRRAGSRRAPPRHVGGALRGASPPQGVSEPGDASSASSRRSRPRRSRAARSRARRATGSSTRTSATSSRATASARSTGARRRAGRASS